MVQITSFQGEYRFLSNFYPSEFSYRGYVWQTVEHAYQAMKFVDQDYWYRMAYGGLTAAQAKREGQNVTLSEHWNSSKVSIMRSLVIEKFNQNPHLMEKLRATAPAKLVEGNSWGDTFWGESPVGTGRNELGKILMSVRDDITAKFM